MHQELLEYGQSLHLANAGRKREEQRKQALGELIGVSSVGNVSNKLDGAVDRVAIEHRSVTVAYHDASSDAVCSHASFLRVLPRRAKFCCAAVASHKPDGHCDTAHITLRLYSWLTSADFCKLYAQLTECAELDEHEFETWFRELVNNPLVVLFGVTLRRTTVPQVTLIGTACLYMQPRYYRNGATSASIEDVVIDAQYRGMGLGRRLVAAAVALWCCARRTASSSAPARAGPSRSERRKSSKR